MSSLRKPSNIPNRHRPQYVLLQFGPLLYLSRGSYLYFYGNQGRALFMHSFIYFHFLSVCIYLFWFQLNTHFGGLLIESPHLHEMFTIIYIYIVCILNAYIRYIYICVYNIFCVLYYIMVDNYMIQNAFNYIL